MSNFNPLPNNSIARLAARAPQNVINAIQKASSYTGVDFSYLVQQAAVESNFQPAAKSRSSSATGLYQFIESTWMNMMDRHADRYGIDISGKSRREILALRKNPDVAAVMAAEFAGENAEFLRANWGGPVGSTELYLAHFLGAGGAASFLQAKDQDPYMQASAIFPDAAHANRNIFYDSRSGRARSIGEVYDIFARKFSGGAHEPRRSYVMADSRTARYEERTAAQPRRSKNYFRTYEQVRSEQIERAPVRRRSYRPPVPQHRMMESPAQVMMMAQLEPPATTRVENRKNSYQHARSRRYND